MRDRGDGPHHNWLWSTQGTKKAATALQQLNVTVSHSMIEVTTYLVSDLFLFVFYLHPPTWTPPAEAHTAAALAVPAVCCAEAHAAAVPAVCCAALGETFETPR